jgi:hypothetical protein
MQDRAKTVSLAIKCELWNGIGESGNTGGFSELTYISIRYLWSRNERQKYTENKEKHFSFCLYQY